MSDVPKLDDFLLPTLQVLVKLGGSGSITEINDGVAELSGLTPEQLDATYPTSGEPIAVDRMSWARTYLKIAGLVSSGGRGVWVLTDEGRAEAEAQTDEHVRKLIAKAANLHNAKLAARKKEREAAAATSGAASPVLAEEEAAEAEDAWTDALLAQLKSMAPDAFERLAQRLLRESGFVRVEVTGKSGDGGIDGSGVLRMNLISFQVLFQCKRYAGSVGSSVVRDFRGAMQGRADKGLIITTGTFTADARREATRDGAPAIDLIDGDALCQLLKDKELGVRVRPVVTQEVTVLPEFFADI
ncbi:restriction endonuclease [Stakelama sediminis]|uniref:Restriction system protein n=1 Tax=Stakelama sediminis TaxID=463200 RepID=A0A840Z0M8_9SPHN|nr:restriction endonuclease [Stakelama sediminis]MBB5719681.1 restriction system protein [Stakelama sediminis]